MELLTGSLAFATIVQLIGVFRSERKATDDTSYETFLGWLRTRRHDETVELLVSNLQAADATKGLLSHQHAELMERIAGLEAIISEIVERVELFEPLATAMGVKAPLSEQARWILKQMNEKNASRFLEAPLLRSGREYILMDGDRGELAISDPRFIEDELNILLELSLLRLDYNTKCERIFHITRTGVSVGS